MQERYSAFVSYSHADGATARWLHHAIERFRFPQAVRGGDSAFGPVPKRLPPVFRDRDELAASADLGADLRAALAASRFQIVLCSPRAAKSKWVNEEILAFKRTHGEHRTLALIVDGEPYAGDDSECFPPALRYRLAPDGTLSTNPAEPIAADIRKGRDGKRLALLKLVAGIADTRLDMLVRRDAARRQRRLAFIAAGASLIALLTIGLAIYAESQRRLAVEEREMAERSLGFLISTFEIANPAKENPRTITALTILDRASTRAEREFGNRPRIAASLLRATGGIYYNLGLPEQSGRDLEKALKLEPADDAGRAATLLKLAALAKLRRDPAGLEKNIAMIEKVIGDGRLTDPKLEAALTEQRGDLAYLRADYPAAAKHYAQGVEQYAALPGDNRDDIVRMLSNHARGLTQQSDTQGTLRLFSLAAKLAVAAHGPADVRAARALQNQAFAFFEAGQARRAEAQMSKAVAIYQIVLDADHPNLASAHLLLGRISSALGDFADARRNFAEARRIQRVINGPDNAATGDIDFYAAEMEGLAGDPGAALELTKNVKRIYDLNYGPDDPDQAELMLLRSDMHARAGQIRPAYRECTQALILQTKIELSGDVIVETKRRCAKIAKTIL